MSNEQYFEAFITYMNSREDLFNDNAWVAYWAQIPNTSIYNEAKEYIKSLYSEDNEAHSAFEEIWAEIHRITFNYSERMNKKSRPMTIRKIQHYMAHCFIREVFDECDIKQGGETAEVVRIFLSPASSKRKNYIAVSWVNLYDSVQSIVHAKKCIEHTTKLTGHDFSFPC